LEASDELVERRKQFLTNEIGKIRNQFINVQSIFQQNEQMMLTNE